MKFTKVRKSLSGIFARCICSGMTDIQPPPPPISSTNTDSWLKRNWGWAVPGGCCGCLILLMIMALGIAVLVFSLFKNSTVYQDAVEIATTDPAVIQQLGSPVKPGFFVSGNISTSGSSGDADFAIPVSGPQGTGTIFVVAEKSGGVWTFTTLAVKLGSDGERVNLLMK